VTALATAGRIRGVEFSVSGTGLPVTVFAHGLGGSAAEVRPLALRTRGTRAVLSFRGHGGSDALPGGWDYDLLADDLRAVADEVGATGCVGLSLGSGVLLRLLRDDSRRFDRLAMVLPAALDAARADGATVRLDRIGSAIDRGDVDAVAALLLAEVPPHLHGTRAVPILLRRRAAELVRRPAPVLLTADRPLPDRAVLSAVHAPCLVVAQREDPLHPVALARELASALPLAELLVLPPGGVFWTATRAVQHALADHLSPEAP